MKGEEEKEDLFAPTHSAPAAGSCEEQRISYGMDFATCLATDLEFAQQFSEYATNPGKHR